MRARLNEGLAYYAQHTKHAGHDACFTHEAAELSFLGLTSSNETALYNAPQTLSGGNAAQQMKELQARTGTLLEGAAVTKETLHEGMVIGIGPANEAGASLDQVQRTGVIFKDKHGKLMVAEGGSGRKPHVTPLNKVLSQAGEKHENLFAADLVTLAEKYGAKPVENFSYSRIQPDASRFASTGITETPPDSDNAAALRQHINTGIEHAAKDGAARHVSYEFGVKDGKTSIDCSGFVRKAADSGFAHLHGKHGYHSSATHELDNCSDAQVNAVFEKTGFMLDGSNVNMQNLKEGMVIGIDSGDHGWDRGRTRGIDHIGTIYRDDNSGKLMFAESSSCRGVHSTPLDQWLKNAHHHHLKLYAVDLAMMADKMGYTAPQEPVATTTTPAKHHHTRTPVVS